MHPLIQSCIQASTPSITMPHAEHAWAELSRRSLVDCKLFSTHRTTALSRLFEASPMKEAPVTHPTPSLLCVQPATHARQTAPLSCMAAPPSIVAAVGHLTCSTHHPSTRCSLLLSRSHTSRALLTTSLSRACGSSTRMERLLKAQRSPTCPRLVARNCHDRKIARSHD